MRIVLIGATGQLGGDLIRHAGEHDIDAPSRDVLDLSRSESAASYVRERRPDVVINCAAFHNVPQCEIRPAEAFQVNCVAVRDLAAACRDVGAWFFTFSTDYVFEGNKRTPYEEYEAARPVQTYGITRLAGECAALATAPERAVVIRTCGLYGRSGARSKGGNFVDGRVADALASKKIEMACEQIVAPTATEDLSHAVLALLAHPALEPGIYHLVNEGQCSWYEFTLAIVEEVGASTDVVPVDRNGLTGGMRRPLYSVLANTRARGLGITLPPWRDALRRYIRSRYSNRTT